MSEVAVGGGGLKTSDKVWSFKVFFFNLSLSGWQGPHALFRSYNKVAVGLRSSSQIIP